MSGAGAGEREAKSSRRPSPLRATVPVQVWATGVFGAPGVLWDLFRVFPLISVLSESVFAPQVCRWPSPLPAMMPAQVWVMGAPWGSLGPPSCLPFHPCASKFSFCPSGVPWPQPPHSHDAMQGVGHGPLWASGALWGLHNIFLFIPLLSISLFDPQVCQGAHLCLITLVHR